MRIASASQRRDLAGIEVCCAACVSPQSIKIKRTCWKEHCFRCGEKGTTLLPEKGESRVAFVRKKIHTYANW